MYIYIYKHILYIYIYLSLYIFLCIYFFFLGVGLRMLEFCGYRGSTGRGPFDPVLRRTHRKELLPKIGGPVHPPPTPQQILQSATLE